MKMTSVVYFTSSDIFQRRDSSVRWQEPITPSALAKRKDASIQKWMLSHNFTSTSTTESTTLLCRNYWQAWDDPYQAGWRNSYKIRDDRNCSLIDNLMHLELENRLSDVYSKCMFVEHNGMIFNFIVQVITGRCHHVAFMRLWREHYDGAIYICVCVCVCVCINIWCNVFLSCTRCVWCILNLCQWMKNIVIWLCAAFVFMCVIWVLCVWIIIVWVTKTSTLLTHGQCLCCLCWDGLKHSLCLLDLHPHQLLLFMVNLLCFSSSLFLSRWKLTECMALNGWYQNTQFT